MFSWARFLRPATVLVLIVACTAAVPTAHAQNNRRRLDGVLSERARTGVGHSRVIVTFKAGWDASEDAKRLGARLGRRLNRNRSRVMELSNAQLEELANHPAVDRIRWDRPVYGMPRDASSARSLKKGVADNLGYTGEGIGVAIIDSGITPWHDDLAYAANSPTVLTKGGQRVADFHDFTELSAGNIPCVQACDPYGHGTHVAGIIAGTGLSSNGVRKGAAPNAHLVVLRVLDATGRGTISDVIAALDYVRDNAARFKIRVVNMSIAAAVLRSIDEDPLADATKRVVDSGIVVVAAAGNLGVNRTTGEPQYGGVTAPGNAPWVLTVGASDQNGTASSSDDLIAPFSSRGPTAFDFLAKPDIVAPGVGILSLADATSELYARHISGLTTTSDGEGRYIRLSGTSLAAPAVSGTVALLAQAYPKLTPNLAKAILQYTAHFDPDYNSLTQGAGFMNAGGAVRLARYFANARPGQRYPRDTTWSRRIIWGNYIVGGGVIWPNASAWSGTVEWGASVEDVDNIVWGTLCEPEDCDNIVWGTFEDGDNIGWTPEDGHNIVWGTACSDPDNDEDCDNIVWGTLTEDGDNIVRGTTCTTNPEDCDNIVWGSSEDVDNIVWGTACGGEDCDNIVWGTSEDGDNIVWGTIEDVDNIVWGTMCSPSQCDWNIVWGTLLDDLPQVWSTAVSAATTTATAPVPWTARKRPRGSSRR